MSRMPHVASIRLTGNPRRASTLMELIVVISVMSLLLATLATVVSRVLRAEASTQEHAPDTGAMSQLGDQFRADVRNATRVVVPNDSSNNVVRIESDARVIEYAINPLQIQRTVAAESDVASRKIYYLPAAVSAEVQTFSAQDRPFARLRLTASGKLPLQYVAQVGRDRRFVDPVELKQP